MPDRSTPRGLVHLLYLLSGAVALVYEITWMGWLGRVFGNTAQAAAATLAAFFLGLGLGAAFFGVLAPRLRRPLRAYGWLEVGVCAAGVGGWLLYRDRAGASGVWAVAWIGPAAFFLGGTFPVLGQAVLRRDTLGRGGALLYAANTIGAAVGALAATFFLLPTFGYQATYLGAMATAGGVGAVAVGIGGTAAGETIGARPRAPSPSLTALAFVSGSLALGLQVLWTRMFAQALPGSVFVFGTVVVVFLVGLSLAGGLAHRLACRSLDARATLGVLLSLSGVLVAASVPLFLWRTDGLRPPAPGTAWGAYLLGVVVDVTVVLLPAVCLLGAVFPYLLKAAEARARSAGRTVGRLAASNTLGAIVGATVAGFVLLELVGLWTSIRLVAAAYAVLGIVFAGRRPWAVGGALLVAASFLLPAPVVRVDAGERLLGVWEGPAGTVSVLERDGERKLVVDNVFTLGGTHDARWEAMQTHVPLGLHPAPRRVLYLGLGTGITAGAALEHPVERVVVAEIVPEVIEAARAHFAQAAGGLFEDPRVEIVADDARHLLRTDERLHDVIVGDLFFPWEAGTASLYTREHFAGVRARLAAGGLFAQWLPCYQMSREEVLGVVKTFAEVFGAAGVWRGDFFADRPLLALVGTTGPAATDVTSFVWRWESLAGGSGDDLAAAAHTIPFHLFAGVLESDSDVLHDARVLTDDRPWIAWTAPRSERAHEGEDRIGLMVGETLLAFERSILPARADPLVEAGLVMRRMAVALHAMRRDEHTKALLDYVRLVPARMRPDLDRWIE